MAGISSKSAGVLENKKNKFQNQEFDDDLGINYYGFKWRNHDPQIGRFIEIDPLAEEYEYNSTYAFSENKVTNHIELEGLEAVSADVLRQAQTLPPQAKVVAGIVAAIVFLGEVIVEIAKSPPPMAPPVPGGLGIPGYDPLRGTYTPPGTPPATVNTTPTEPNSRQGKPFTPKEKEKVIEANKAKNNGATVCENCQTNTTKPDQSKKGVTPPTTDTQVDHVKPKSKGGSGTADNGQVLCRDCNGKKSDKVIVPEKKN